MDLFYYEVEKMDSGTAKKELTQKWKDYCLDVNNPLLLNIYEAKSTEELKNICLFLRSLSILLQDIDPAGNNYDYANYLELLAGAVRANELKLGGAEISPDEDAQIKKYALGI